MSRLYRFLWTLYNDHLRPHRLAELKRRGLDIGADPVILRNVFIDPSHCWLISIGDYVRIGDFTQILAHDASTKDRLGYTRIGKVTIGDRVFLGASCIVLPGVGIGSDVIVGAGTVVSSDIPDRTVVAGNPCRAVCSVEDFLSRRKREMEVYPCFGEEFTLGRKVSKNMKDRMNRLMDARHGFVV
jgi:maltose O-acetyltransferase